MLHPPRPPHPHPHPAVRLDRVGKQYAGGADAYAVRDVTLDITPGEFFSLLGPSGCGKTTLLRMIGGFADPTEGSVLLDGEEVSGLPPDKRNVNTVFQSYALFDHLSLADNVAAIRALPVSEQAKEAILGGTAVRLYRIGAD